MSYMHQVFGSATLVVLALVLSTKSSHAADTTATWDGTFLNNWSDTARWTTNPDLSPIIPNNGATTFDVVIDTGNVIQDVPGGVTVNNLDLIDGFLSGDEPLTILGETGDPLAISTWVGLTQNTELRNTARVTVASGATLEIDGSGFKAIGALEDGDEEQDLARLTIEGAAVLRGGGSIRATGEGALLEIAATGSLDWVTNAGFDGSASGTLSNAGTVTKSDGEGLAHVGSNWLFDNAEMFRVESGTVRFAPGANGFTNSGTVEVSGAGTLLQLGGGSGTGVIQVAADATLNVQTSNITAQQTFEGAAASLANAGTLNVAGNLNFNDGATLSGDGEVNFTSGVLGGDSAISIANFNWTGGRIANSGGVTVPNGATAVLAGGGDKRLGSGGLLVVEGKANVTGSGDIDAVASAAEITIVAGGVVDIQTNADFIAASPSGTAVMNNSGTFRKSAGTGITQVEAAWTFSNSGLIDIDLGTLQFDGAFAHTGAGSIDVAAGATIRFNGPVGGENSFLGEGAVVFSGSYQPGASAAELSFAGDVVFGAASNLFLEIGGTGNGEFDALDITGDLNFLGALHLSLVELEGGEGIFVPSPGDSFELITFAGTIMPGNPFAATTLPPAPAMTSWSLDVLPGSVVLSLSKVVIPDESGDFNGDSIVNLADYTRWRERLGTGEGTPGSLTLADGDANGDGLVESNDYAVWKSQFGTQFASASLPGTHSIPEPASSVAMWSAVIALVYNWLRLLRV